jgi:hypothetical protein
MGLLYLFMGRIAATWLPPLPLGSAPIWCNVANASEENIASIFRVKYGGRRLVKNFDDFRTD